MCVPLRISLVYVFRKLHIPMSNSLRHPQGVFLPEFCFPEGQARTRRSSEQNANVNLSNGSAGGGDGSAGGPGSSGWDGSNGSNGNNGRGRGRGRGNRGGGGGGWNVNENFVADGDDNRDAGGHGRANGVAGGSSSVARSRSESGTSGTRSRGAFGGRTGSVSVPDPVGVPTESGAIRRVVDSTSTTAPTAWASPPNINTSSTARRPELQERELQAGEVPRRPGVAPAAAAAVAVEAGAPQSFGLVGGGAGEPGKESGTPAKRRRKSEEGIAREGVVIPNE